MITKHLQDCINYIPKNRWFKPYEIPSPVSRNRWVCDRLEEEGVLKKKIEWVIDKDLPMEVRSDFRVETFYYFENL